MKNAELYRTQMEDEVRKAKAAAARKEKAAKKLKEEKLAAKADEAIKRAEAKFKALAAAKGLNQPLVTSYAHRNKAHKTFNTLAQAEETRQNSNL